jgi:hypothetical protein
VVSALCESVYLIVVPARTPLDALCPAPTTRNRLGCSDSSLSTGGVGMGALLPIVLDPVWVLVVVVPVLSVPSGLVVTTGG